MTRQRLAWTAMLAALPLPEAAIPARAQAPVLQRRNDWYGRARRLAGGTGCFIPGVSLDGEHRWPADEAFWRRG